MARLPVPMWYSRSGWSNSPSIVHIGDCSTSGAESSNSYRDLGEQQAKGFDEPVRVFAVELKSGDSVPAPEGQPTIESHRKRRYRPWLLFASTALILVVSGLAAWFYQTASLREMGRAGSDQAAPSHQASIVVLPFDNLSNDEEQEYFANGLTDDLITDLAKIPELFVIARNSSFAFKKGAAPT